MPEIRARVLPSVEWAEKLVGTPLEGRALNPAHTRVIVVEEAGRVIGHCVVLTLVHAESFWQAEDRRHHAGVSRALLGQLVQVLVAEQVPEVLSQCESPEMAEMFARIGGSAIPGTCWVIPVEVSSWG